jgi:hypothetical protein
MIPKIKPLDRAGNNECRMCGKRGHLEFFQYESKMSPNDKFIVCKKCAIREYYGTKGTQGKFYRKEEKEEKMFGKKILNN